MRILATDLDRTLLPNGEWLADPGAIDIFNELTRKNDVLLVYVTGRNLALTEQAIREYGVRHPDILCGDVGTTIRKYKDGIWSFDESWSAHVRRSSSRWDAKSIRDLLAEISGIKEQEHEHLNSFKQSYYVDHARRDEIIAAVSNRVKGKFDEIIVYSFDSCDGKGLLDILPDSATKQTALEFVADEYGQSHKDVVYCGDSGNDVCPLTAGFAGVLVRNADAQLVEAISKAQHANPDLKIYFAKGSKDGGSGYYTSGVIEGAYHYGVFKD